MAKKKEADGEKKRWVLKSMLREDTIVETIEEMEAKGYHIELFIPTGSYFSLLFCLGS